MGRDIDAIGNALPTASLICNYFARTIPRLDNFYEGGPGRVRRNSRRFHAQCAQKRNSSSLTDRQVGMAKLKPVYFESQKQCSAMLGIPEYKLKEWKAQGAPCFRYSRIYHAELLEWIKKDGRPVGGNEEPPKSHWDREKARVDFERAVLCLEIEQKKHVVLGEICGALGQMLAGFRTAINMLPGSAARWLVGLKDFHVIKNKLQSEVDRVLQSLGRCRYLEDLAPAVIDRVLTDRTKKYRDEVQKIVTAVFIELGRECFRELQIDLDEPPAETKRVSHG